MRVEVVTGASSTVSRAVASKAVSEKILTLEAHRATNQIGRLALNTSNAIRAHKAVCESSAWETCIVTRTYHTGVVSSNTDRAHLRIDTLNAKRVILNTKVTGSSRKVVSWNTGRTYCLT